MLLSSIRSWLRLPLTAVLALTLVLPGCASMGGGEGDDPTDSCRADRAALRNTGDFFTQDILGGAAIGAVGGGLIGLAAGGNARSAVLGALAGGAAGAAGGYFVARQKQAANDAQLYSTVSSDIDRENLSIDKTQYAFDRLVACRNNQAARIRADLRAGAISRPQAAAAMDGVRARAQSDLRLASSISQHIQERGNDFSYANDQVRQQASGGSSYAAPARGRRVAARPAGGAAQVQQATSTNVAKRDQFQNSIARAQANQASAFELS